MLRDLLPFEDAWRHAKGSEPPNALVKLLTFIDTRLGTVHGYDASGFPLGDPRFATVNVIAEKMMRAGCILSMHRVPSLDDEPPMRSWMVRFREGEESRSMGGSPDDDVLALTIALAEAQERYIWVFRDDYFEDARDMSLHEMASRPLIDPRTFAGFSDAQRASDPRLQISTSSRFRWVRGYSHVQDRSVHIPASTVSRHGAARAPQEPLIRKIISTGLATYPDRNEALVRGASEVIERDAYMIAWLNQLTLPRIDLATIPARDAGLDDLLRRTERYRLIVHAVRLITDAPTHAIMVIVEDESGHAPRYAFGLKTHRSLSIAIKGALIEALRVRRGIRTRLSDPDREPRPETIGHYDRHEYWSEGDNHERLAFLSDGPVTVAASAPWENDTVDEHWQRIVSWCRERGYECVSVPLTRSAMNVTPWHIEMVVIPELQPIHYSESLPHIGGTRLREIPEQFGYRSRDPFVAEPHPFA